MTIPPYGPAGGGPYGGPPATTNDDLLAELRQQRHEIARLGAELDRQSGDLRRLRTRTGWILLWVSLLMFFGGCAGAHSGDTSRIEDQLRQLRQSVDQVHQQQLQPPAAPAARTP